MCDAVGSEQVPSPPRSKIRRPSYDWKPLSLLFINMKDRHTDASELDFVVGNPTD